MISDTVFQLATSDLSVSSEWAKDPSKVISHVKKDVFGKHPKSTNESLDYPIATPPELERARQCGKWNGTEPSELFLRMFHDVLLTLDQDPLIGVVSPSLIGSSGVMPVTIISHIWDIIRHMANLIVRAETEIYLATNYWLFSDSSTMITNAIRELDRRAGKRGQKVVLKIIYDRGTPSQAIHNHQQVTEKQWTADAVKLPHAHEIPNIQLEVVNYHKPLLGTFHAKYMVVDRKIAVIGSNNIQDNANFEMLTHLEGPIVDSFYDMCLLSWANAMTPPLPLINRPAAGAGSASSFDLPSHGQMFDAQGSFLRNDAAARAPGQHIVAQEHQERGPSERLPLLTPEQEHYDVDIAGEVKRVQSALTPTTTETAVQLTSRHLNTKQHSDMKGDAPEPQAGNEYTPYIVHPVHRPFPIAMVSRKPWGAPTHNMVNVPQNAAFISALRNAKHNVYIQTPNLNAKRLLPEIIGAVKRKILITYVVCLGYNDSGELLPAQNGTNEMIANQLYSQLNEEEKKYLDIYNYVAKDMTHPIHDSKKARSCHVKLMLVDDHIGILGNGNQDTQSWYQSQEANIMFDDATVCAAYKDGLVRNQNSFLYGAVDKSDGCWKDASGKMAEGSIGTDPGRFSWAKGLMGAVARVRGTGGF
ncbi:hypothetical protein HKX48_004126 [Thoreauomyces humboldtii]|nr:hypothetical protein HKX48_004126 [Thoreauomyces humboldtii]